MNINQAINILETHNKWRRGDEKLPQMNPRQLGDAIDLVVETFKKAENFRIKRRQKR